MSEDTADPAVGQVASEQSRTWRVSAAVAFPALVVGEMPPGGGMPEQLVITQRIGECQCSIIRSIQVCVRGWTGPAFPENPMAQVEWAEFFCDLESPSGMDAAEVGAGLISVLLDDTSFRMATPLVISQLEAIDVSLPAIAGEQRERALFPYPNGYPSWRLRSSTALGHVTAEQTVKLLPSYNEVVDREKRVLDWYLKAVIAPFEVDQFVFMWISLEVLMAGDSAPPVEAPFRGPCGHEIAQCPECTKPTMRKVQGPSVKNFLVAHGATAEDATCLWKTRQMMHGAADLTKDGLSDLSRQVQILRACVVRALKPRLGIEETESPTVQAGAFAFGSGVVVGGSREVGLRDLESGCPS